MKTEFIAVLCLSLAVGAAACRREQRRFSEQPVANRLLTRDQNPALDHDQLLLYSKNAWAISEGQRLFSQMNCVGCHAHGGGGMGPPLMDARWRYGATPDDIARSIVQGRPRGMPSFGSRLSAQQVWQLAAYVRSLGGNAPSDAAPVRDDHMAVRPPPSRTGPQPPVSERVD